MSMLGSDFMGSEWRIIRVITAAYLPADVSFLVEVAGYRHYIDGDDTAELPTILKQARTFPTGIDLPGTTKLDPLPQYFLPADAFWQDGIEYRRKIPLYPFIPDQFGHFVSMHPLDTKGQCDVFIEYADLYEGTNEYNQLVSAKMSRDREEIRLVGVTDEGKRAILLCIYDQKFYPGSIAGMCLNTLTKEEQTTQAWFREVASWQELFTHNLGNLVNNT